MCFSAEASFTAGALLCVIGGLTLKKNTNRSRTLIAMVPFLFGIQQFAEGVVWLHMNGEFEATALSTSAKMVFLSFAWVLWPIWVPLAFLVAERSFWRKAVCIASLCIGLTIAFYDITYMLSGSITPQVVENSLYYSQSSLLDDSLYDNLWYSLSALPPIFISSIPYMWVFGAILATSFILSQLIWAYTFTSVWCFFAAVSSLVLLWIIPKKPLTIL